MPWRTASFLLLVVFSLILAGSLAKLSLYFLSNYSLIRFIATLTNLDGENNLPSLYSSLSLLFCSCLLAVITALKKTNCENFVRHWGALAIIFLYLSLDEFFGFHEKLSKFLNLTFHTSGFLRFAWVVPGVIFVFVCLLAFLQFLMHLPSKTRRLFFVAGTIFISGAVGMEMVGGYFVSYYGFESIIFTTTSTIEELFEMLGIVIFIYALLSYISSFMKGVSLRINIIADAKQRRSA